jgi:hypothetical protein
MTAPPAPRKVDRYGCYETQQAVSAREASLSAAEGRKEDERTAKWLAMLSADWSGLRGSLFSAVARRVRKGIPDGVRSRAWQRLTDSGAWRARTPPFADLRARAPMEGYRTIDVDLSRTFPQMFFYSQGGMIESLRQVLYAYCQFDPEVGYCQGMSFLAGLFTAYMDAESAFFCFAGLMQGAVAQRAYFLPGFPRLMVANDMFELLLGRREPRVKAHLDALGICCAMYTPRWFSTAYQCLDWQPELQFRIFERFLFYGTRFLLWFGMGIVREHREQLAGARMEVILPILQRPNESPRLSEWHTLLRKWERFWIRKKEYAELVRLTQR